MPFCLKTLCAWRRAIQGSSGRLSTVSWPLGAQTARDKIFLVFLDKNAIFY
jgi:hypothetical protein